MQQFGYLDPVLIVELLRIYATALYGSPLWHLSSAEHQQLTRAWNTAMKIVWRLPSGTHTRFLESLSSVPHLESVLFGRYIGFVENLEKTEHVILDLLFSTFKYDSSSQTGSNIKYLLDKFKLITLADLVKEKQNLKRNRVNKLLEDELN